MVRVGLLFASFRPNEIRPSVDDSNDLVLFCCTKRRKARDEVMCCIFRRLATSFLLTCLAVCLPAGLLSCSSIRLSTLLVDRSLAAPPFDGTLGALVDVGSLHPDHFLKKASVEQRREATEKKDQSKPPAINNTQRLPASAAVCSTACLPARCEEQRYLTTISMHT